MSLIESISGVYKKISHAAMKAGRDPSEVKLLAVTKTVPPELVREAVDAGIRLIGENRVQEARAKVEALRGVIPDTVSWHLIGHLKSNKARAAVGLFDVIQSLDSIELARRIDRYAGEAGKVQDLLIQVKLAEEEGKSGMSPDDLPASMDALLELKNIRINGLMTIPPFFEDPVEARPYFRRLRELRDSFSGRGIELPELSMGMSGDYEIAVEEGATMVRVGAAIFGDRSY